jgi:competence protein ComEC
MKAYWQSWCGLNPLLLMALAGCVGICASEWGFGKDSWLDEACAIALLGLLGWRPRAWLLLAVTALVFAARHEVELGQTWRHPLRDLLLHAGSAEVVLRGSITPRLDGGGAGRTGAVCEVELVTLADGKAWPLHAHVAVWMPRGQLFPGAGVYELRGRLSLPATAAAPGCFDAEQWMLRSGLVAEMQVTSLHRVTGVGAPLSCAMLLTSQRCREWISSQLTQDIAQDHAMAGVIRAMALGVADEAQDEIEQAFRDSGTLHVFAISGLHVALLGMMALEVLRMLSFGRRRAVLLAVLVVFGYAFVTGWRPSAARAAVMMAVMQCLPLVRRGVSMQNTLGLAALLLLAMDTQQLFLPGFQLSFGVLWSMAGSGWLMRPFLSWMELDPFLPRRLASPRQLMEWRLRRWVVVNACVSVAAWLGSLPFILWHFQAMTPVAIVANSILVPLSMCALAVTCAAMAVAAMQFSGVLVLLNNANWLMAKLMVLSATWFASWPGGNFHVPNVEGLLKPQPQAAWRILAMPEDAAANHLRVKDQHWLFDAGGREGYGKVLYPYLRHAGVNELEGIFISHNDADHAGGVEAAARAFGRPRLMASPLEPGPQDASTTSVHRLLRSELAEQWMTLHADEELTLAPEVRVTSLHPRQGSRVGRADDRAMVLRAAVHGWRMLWASDAGWNTLHELAGSPVELHSEVLILSQPPPASPELDDFLTQVSPRLVISSSHLPSTTLAAWCRAHDAIFIETRKEGSVLLEIEPGSLRASSTRRGPLEVLSRPHQDAPPGGR